MNIKRNNIIIIQDYECGVIEMIRDSAQRVFGQDNVGESLPKTYNATYALFVSCNDTEKEIIKQWCDIIYKEWIPLNMVVLNIGEGGMSYIDYQYPEIEKYFE